MNIIVIALVVNGENRWKMKSLWLSDTNAKWKRKMCAEWSPPAVSAIVRLRGENALHKTPTNIHPSARRTTTILAIAFSAWEGGNPSIKSTWIKMRACFFFSRTGLAKMGPFSSTLSCSPSLYPSHQVSEVFCQKWKLKDMRANTINRQEIPLWRNCKLRIPRDEVNIGTRISKSKIENK